MISIYNKPSLDADIWCIILSWTFHVDPAIVCHVDLSGFPKQTDPDPSIRVQYLVTRVSYCRGDMESGLRNTFFTTKCGSSFRISYQPQYFSILTTFCLMLLVFPWTLGVQESPAIPKFLCDLLSQFWRTVYMVGCSFGCPPSFSHLLIFRVVSCLISYNLENLCCFCFYIREAIFLTGRYTSILSHMSSQAKTIVLKFLNQFWVIWHPIDNMFSCASNIMGWHCFKCFQNMIYFLQGKVHVKLWREW